MYCSVVGKIKGKRRNVKSDLKQEEMGRIRLIEGKGKTGRKVGRHKGGGGGQLLYRYIIWETHIDTIHRKKEKIHFLKGKGDGK
jgi:hypothetical protein